MRVETILDVVRHSVPSVVVDVPNMWAPWIKYTLVQADDVVITATPELASLRNAKNLIDLLKAGAPERSAAASRAQPGRRAASARKSRSPNSPRRSASSRPWSFLTIRRLSAPPRATAR